MTTQKEMPSELSNQNETEEEIEEIAKKIEKDLGKEISFDKVSLEVNYPPLQSIDSSKLKKFLLKFVKGIDDVYYEKDKLVWNEEGDIELWRKGEVNYAWSYNIFRKFIIDYFGVKEDDKEKE